MPQVIRATITGTGMSVPAKVVTNQDLAMKMTTSDEWIQQRSGIKERRYVIDGETPSSLGTEAALKALQSAKISPKDIDLILVATLSPEHYFPGTSSFIQRNLALETTPAMDIRAQCTGFLYGLSVANAMIVSGQYKRILLIGVEVQSRGLDFSDRGRDVAVLFGDGAGAVIVERSPSPEHGIMNIKLHAQGEHAEKLWIEYPAMSRTEYCSPQIVADGGLHPKMDGKFVFKNAVVRIPEVMSSCLNELHLTTTDIDTFIFHQANLRINEFIAQSANIPAHKCPSNIDRYGNCSAASIPILLDECVKNNSLKQGSLVCLAGFGSGFTWGSAVIRWS